VTTHASFEFVVTVTLILFSCSFLTILLLLTYVSCTVTVLPVVKTHYFAEIQYMLSLDFYDVD